ncbi:MAG: beta-galactosidase [Burkholderiales bacterium]|nr:beta-galactosidase [Anaerolineae bacterium]
MLITRNRLRHNAVTFQLIKHHRLIVHISLQTLAIWWLLSSLAAPTPRAPLGVPQTVETIQPHVCVHTRLIDEVDEWKIQRSLQLVREMGADTIVEFFPWAYIENVENVYDWASTDRIVRQAQNQGIHIIARLGFVPAWARRADPTLDEAFTTLNTLPPAAYSDFAEFVAEFATRYAGVIDHLIIWNEPNLAFEWGFDHVDPEGYARLLEAVYAPAHAANPNVVILAAGFAPTLEPSGSPHGLNDLLYLGALYEAGAKPYFDALAVHTYGFTSPPEAPSAPDQLNFRRAELLRNVMLHYDDAATPVYITETGWNDSPRWVYGVRPSLRLQYTIDAFTYADENWPWLAKMCIWALRFPTPTRSYPDNFTLVTNDFQPRPLYYAIQSYARGWETSTTQWLPAPFSAR